MIITTIALAMTVGQIQILEDERYPKPLATAIVREAKTWLPEVSSPIYIWVNVTEATRCTDGQVNTWMYRAHEPGPRKALPVIYFRDDTPIAEIVCEAVYNIRLAILSSEVCRGDLCDKAVLLLPCGKSK